MASPMNKTKNIVFIAQSLDGFIAGPNGELDWLDIVNIPDGTNTGYFEMIDEVDALLMGRNTYEIVQGFDIEWPYKKHVFVLSNTLNSVTKSLKKKVTIVNGYLESVLNEIHQKGFHCLYVDGGKLIQSLLNKDLIDEMRITTLPIILGNGIPLFGDIKNRLTFELKSSTIIANQLVFSIYNRKDLE